MRRLLLAALAVTLLAQEEPRPRRPFDPDPPEVRLPNGKLQSEEILKAEHARSLQDAAKLVQLAGELEAELKRDDRHIVSVPQIRRTEEIEKLAKRIRGRLQR